MIELVEGMYSMPAEQAAEALMASMKLNGIDRLWFTSGTELAFFQEVPVKHQALGRPTPKIMTMTHENAALSAACGETMISGKPSATAAHVECGMINAGGSIHNADRGHYPVLMMSGYPPSAESGSVPGARGVRPRRAARTAKKSQTPNRWRLPSSAGCARFKMARPRCSICGCRNSSPGSFEMQIDESDSA